MSSIEFASESDVLEHYNKDKEGNQVIIFEGVVYNVKEYMPDHPGGGDLIGEHLGKNIETDFEDAEHTKYATKLLKGLPQVGKVSKAKEPEKKVDTTSAPQTDGKSQQKSKWSLIYDLDEVTKYVNLDGEDKSKNQIRYFLILLQILLIALTIYAFSFKMLFYYLTNWTMLFQTLSLILTVKAVDNPKFKNDVSAVAQFHFFYTICIILNFIVVAIYWGLMWKEQFEKFQGQNLKLFQQAIVHIQPAVVGMINSYMTNAMMTKSLLPVMMYISVFYQSINFVQTKLSGEPVYSFQPWDPFHETAILLTVLISIFAGFYLFFCKIDETIKGPRMSKVKAN